jgi:pilus assembly protein FimV
MRFRVASAVALLTAVPAISHALGLGDETVRSYLNAPLNAEIELFATPEELQTLRVQLASREDFIRHGLDYPGFLTTVQVRAERLGDGRNVIRLSTSQAVSEPFLVLLVDVRSDGGRLLREYTLLLDPPAFQTQSAPPPPVTAPSVGESPGNAIRPATPAPTVPQPQAPRPASQPQPQVARPAQPAPAPTGGGGQYSVRRGDTLTSIATREYGSQEVERAMIAIFRANPQAFSGNINYLRAGATLALPDQGAMASLSRAEANTEVRSQMSAWRANVAPTPDSAEARLRLVPPGGTDGDAASTSTTGDRGAGTTPGAAAPDRPVAV